MLNVSTRLRVLIGIAVALSIATAARFLLSGGDGATAPRDPNLARVEKHRRARDVPALAKEASHSDENVARHAVEALGQMGPASLPYVRQALRDARPKVREKAAIAFAHAGRHDDAGDLAEVARQDNSPGVRAAAVSSLDRLCAFEEMESLLDAMEDRDVAVRRRAHTAVVRLICIDVGYKPEDPPEKRGPAVREMRAVWAEQKERVRNYWTAVFEMRAEKGG